MESKNNKVVLVTGASSGIGLAIAREFLKYGYRVYGTSRDIHKTNELVEEGIIFETLDLADDNSIKNCIENILTREEKIDILVNNAGYGLIGPVAEIPVADFELQFKTNVFGLLMLSQPVMQKMISQKKGLIVNISSIAAVITTAFSSAYCASKAAVNAISDSMRLELEPFGIKVVTVQPGAIKSNFGNTASLNIDRYQSGSAYQKISDFIVKRAMQSQVNSTGAGEFASRLVKKLLHKNPPSLIRIGKQSFRLPFIKRWLPTSLTDRLIRRHYGLNRL